MLENCAIVRTINTRIFPFFSRRVLLSPFPALLLSLLKSCCSFISTYVDPDNYLKLFQSLFLLFFKKTFFSFIFFPANAHDCENFMLTLDYKIISSKYYTMAKYDKFINSCQPPVFINETKSRLFYDFPLKGALRHRH